MSTTALSTARADRSFFSRKTLRAAACAFALLGAAGGMAACSSTPRDESTGQYIDSSVITTKVKSALLQEPGLKASQISVETFKDIVQLSGFVDSSAARTRAGEVTASIEGVRGVKNDLVVK